MAVSPQYQGKYGKPWTISLMTDSGIDDITNIALNNISVVVRNLNVTPATDAVSTGAIATVTTKPAVITWQPTAADYATAGNWAVVPEVNFGTGPVAYDPIPFTILPV